MRDTPKNFYKKLLGRIGEKKAEKFLKSKGYKIIEKNFTTNIGEIDLICKDEDYLVFVEVKTRKTNAFGAPSEAVDHFKRQKYKLLANAYLAKIGKLDVSCRFDVVEITDKEINHIINAFCV